MLEIVKSLPEGIELSKDIRERASRYFVISMFGRKFYVPVTKSTMAAMNVDKSGKPCTKPHKHKDGFDAENTIDKALRDVIYSVYLQVRDNVLDEIQESVKDEVLQRLGEMMDRPLRRQLEERASEVEQKKLEVHNEQEG